MAKLFPKLQLQAKLKTNLYLKTGLDSGKYTRFGNLKFQRMQNENQGYYLPIYLDLIKKIREHVSLA